MSIYRALAVAALTFMASQSPASARTCVADAKRLMGQTTSGYMHVQKDKRCALNPYSGTSGIAGASIDVKPSHGKAWVGPTEKIFYEPARGYVGKDAFTYSRNGIDRYGRNGKFTVNMDVDVVPDQLR